jgi:hypothetical protein
LSSDADDHVTTWMAGTSPAMTRRKVDCFASRAMTGHQAFA